MSQRRLLLDSGIDLSGAPPRSGEPAPPAWRTARPSPHPHVACSATSARTAYSTVTYSSIRPERHLRPHACRSRPFLVRRFQPLGVVGLAAAPQRQHDRADLSRDGLLRKVRFRAAVQQALVVVAAPLNTRFSVWLKFRFRPRVCCTGLLTHRPLASHTQSDEVRVTTRARNTTRNCRGSGIDMASPRRASSSRPSPAEPRARGERLFTFGAALLLIQTSSGRRASHDAYPCKGR